MSSNSLSIFKRLQSIYSIVELESKRHQKSIMSIIVEMIHFYAKTSIGPNYYLLAGMANPNMRWQAKCQHLSNAHYHQALDILNPKSYRKLTQHKLNEKAFLTLAKIPTAEFIGFYQTTGGFDCDGVSLTNIVALSTLLSRYHSKRVCIKLLEGSGGAGFFAAEVQCNVESSTLIAFKCIDTGHTIPLMQVIQTYSSIADTEGLLFESYIEQSYAYAMFNSSSVNTVRTWVLQTDDKIELLGGYFRIGREGSLTDNGDGGGIMCPIDSTTGTLSKGLLTSTSYRDELDQHCDNQVQLNGVVLSRWHDIVTCSCETLRKLPNTRFVGLDICMTNDGPLIIEVNVAPDKDGAAYAGIPSYLLAKAAKTLKSAS